ncbi:hypothetical protein CV093_20805 [Oceanobacillus sp. 143]|uniref:hypothetical protein n=1 Tax=Oceanobacillus zhaokaii TaxID=2052660 RepID=UPI0013191B90|nr:hypothetical protein [Oceanobacillus zhaokaii]QGS69777.1 hypothetical protein CV093_20805 [Oceanobacillus sp. 143]
MPIIDQEDHWQIGIVWKKDGYTSHAAKAWIMDPIFKRETRVTAIILKSLTCNRLTVE